MSVSVKSPPPVSLMNVRTLAGKTWKIGADELRFAPLNSDGTLPVLRGADGIAIPCVDEHGEVNAWLKLATGGSWLGKRAQRSQWLIAQQVWSWSDELSAAPRLWLDTTQCSRPDGIDFDFAGYLSDAAAGHTWCELRNSVKESGLGIVDEWRQRWAQKLLRSLIVLEQHGLVHGDLSPNNLVLSTTPEVDLRLIDFDGFVAGNAAVELARLSNSESGTVGTPGYLPCDLEKRHSNGDVDLTPYSDLHARDMLLIELLCFDSGFPEEDAPEKWDWSRIQTKLQTNSPPGVSSYLGNRDIFTRAENCRASSAVLARALCGTSASGSVQPTAASTQSSFPTPRVRRQSGLPVDWQQQANDSTGTYGVLVPSTASSMPQSYGRSSPGLRSILWGLCVLYWALTTCLTLSSVLGAAGFNEITAVGMLAAIFVGWFGIRQATSVAFGENYPVTYQVSRWRLTLAPWRSLSNPPTNAERNIRLLLCTCVLHFLFRRVFD